MSECAVTDSRHRSYDEPRIFIQFFVFLIAHFSPSLGIVASNFDLTVGLDDAFKAFPLGKGDHDSGG
jgi:hypothetical protein